MKQNESGHFFFFQTTKQTSSVFVLIHMPKFSQKLLFFFSSFILIFIRELDTIDNAHTLASKNGMKRPQVILQ